MATGTRFACMLVLALACFAHEAAADGAKHAKEASIPEIKLDLRAEGRVHETRDKSSGSPSKPDTTADGLPRWMASVPDSMRATVSTADSATYVRVHVDKVGNSIALSIVGPSGLVRRATLPPSPASTRTWTWDVRDFGKVRVPPGIYEVRVSSPDAQVNGYAVVQK
jgi:hypothetical protein